VVTLNRFAGEADAWDTALAAADAGNFYQSHAWGEYRGEMGWQPLRVIGAGEGATVATMAQMLVRRQFGVTIAWVPGGPAGDFRHWAVALPDLLRSRFGVTAYCRVNVLREHQAAAESQLTAAGWRRPQVRLGTGLSLELDLRPTAAERMALASGNWRHNLRRSGKYGLTVEPWSNPDAAQMAAVYREMEDYKGLAQQHSEQALRSMLRHLGTSVTVLRCLDDQGNLLAFRAAGVFGGRAWDLLAAATPPARKVYSSHALLWALTEACREQGALAYDLGGADPVANKGVFDFKRGTGARLIEYEGEWEWAGMPLLGTAVGWAMKHRGMAA
jgi:hypothetical protein